MLEGWRKSAFFTRPCFPCTIRLIMQYMESVSEWSCWRMFIEPWPHSELNPGNMHLNNLKAPCSMCEGNLFVLFMFCNPTDNCVGNANRTSLITNKAIAQLPYMFSWKKFRRRVRDCLCISCSALWQFSKNSLVIYQCCHCSKFNDIKS